MQKCIGKKDSARGNYMRIAVVDIGGTAIKTGIWDGTVLSEQKEWDTNAQN